MAVAVDTVAVVVDTVEPAVAAVQTMEALLVVEVVEVAEAVEAEARIDAMVMVMVPTPETSSVDSVRPKHSPSSCVGTTTSI